MEQDHSTEIPQINPSNLEGIKDEQFLVFMESFQSHLIKKEDSVVVSDTLHAIADKFFPIADKNDRKRAVNNLKTRLERIEKVGVISIETTVVKGNMVKRRVFSEVDALRAGSYLYANELKMKELMLPFVPLHAALYAASDLWGDHPNATVFKNAANQLRKTEERVDDAPVTPEEIRQKNMKRLIHELPPLIQEVSFYDTSQMSEILKTLATSFPGYKFDGTTIPLKNFLIPKAAIKSARSVRSYDLKQLHNFEFDPEELPARDVYEAFRHSINMAIQYEQYFLSNRSHHGIEPTVSLGDVVAIKVNKMKRELAELQSDNIGQQP